MARCLAVAMSQAPGLSRDARLRPLLERGDERVLRELLGQADVAHDPREAGDEPRRLDSPDRVDRAVRVGSRHGYRSDHLQSLRARPRQLYLDRVIATRARGVTRGFPDLVMPRRPPEVTFESGNSSTLTRCP